MSPIDGIRAEAGIRAEFSEKPGIAGNSGPGIRYGTPEGAGEFQNSTAALPEESAAAEGVERFLKTEALGSDPPMTEAVAMTSIICTAIVSLTLLIGLFWGPKR